MNAENKGPWGQNNDAVDAAGRRALEAEIDKSTQNAVAVAKFTKSLKKSVREGDEKDAMETLKSIFFPVNLIPFRDSVLTIFGFVMTVLEETGKKHGWPTIETLLQEEHIVSNADALRKVLQQKDYGWKKR